MLPKWFLTKKGQEERRDNILEILCNFVVKDISNIIIDYRECILNIYDNLDLSYYEGYQLKESEEHVFIELTENIYLYVDDDLLTNASIYATCKESHWYRFKTKRNTYIGMICDIQNDYTYRLMSDRIEHKVTKEEYEQYENNYQYLMNICE